MSKTDKLLAELRSIKEPAVGPFLKHLRSKFGLTQEFISKKIGVSRPTLNKIETGKAEISLLQAKKLADFYNLPLQNFLSGEDSMQNLIRINLSSQLPTKAQPAETDMATGLKERNPLNDRPAYRQDLAPEVVLFICTKLMAEPAFSEINLKQLMFLLEANAHKKLGYPFLGLRFLRNSAGPEPLLWQELIAGMCDSALLCKINNVNFKFPEQKYLPLRPARLESIRANELVLIEDIICTAGMLTRDELLGLIERVEQYQKIPLYKEIPLI